jgi:hypothetical protein
MVERTRRIGEVVVDQEVGTVVRLMTQRCYPFLNNASDLQKLFYTFFLLSCQQIGYQELKSLSNFAERLYLIRFR